MADFWFRPKTRGFGAAPSNWKGWAAIVVAILGSLTLVVVLLLLPLATGGMPSLGRIVLFLVADTALIAGFLIVVRKKTDGPWRWRWGA